jgi:antitoxin ChpS
LVDCFKYLNKLGLDVAVEALRFARARKRVSNREILHFARSDSDADVAVLLRGPRGHFLDTKLDMVDVAYEVLLETEVHIQRMPIWEDEWKHPQSHSNPCLLENIEREGITL